MMLDEEMNANHEESEPESESSEDQEVVKLTEPSKKHCIQRGRFA